MFGTLELCSQFAFLENAEDDLFQKGYKADAQFDSVSVIEQVLILRIYRVSILEYGYKTCAHREHFSSYLSEVYGRKKIDFQAIRDFNHCLRLRYCTSSQN